MTGGEGTDRRTEEKREAQTRPREGMRVEIEGTAEEQQPENFARTTPTRGPRAPSPLQTLAICLGLAAAAFILWLWASVP